MVEIHVKWGHIIKKQEINQFIFCLFKIYMYPSVNIAFILFISTFSQNEWRLVLQVEELLDNYLAHNYNYDYMWIPWNNFKHSLWEIYESFQVPLSATNQKLQLLIDNRSIREILLFIITCQRF